MYPEPKRYCYRFITGSNPIPLYFYDTERKNAIEQYKFFLKDLGSKTWDQELPKTVKIARAIDHDKPFVEMEIPDNER